MRPEWSVNTGRPDKMVVIRTIDDDVDLRIFSLGGGPAKVWMPTKAGFTISPATLSSFIRALQAWENKSRPTMLNTGDA